MTTLNDICTTIIGSDLKDSFDNSDISGYLVDLLSKDYNYISSISRNLLENDEKFRNKLHKFVIDSAHIALKNINCCTNTSDNVIDLSKTASDISRSSTSSSLKAMESLDTLSILLDELNDTKDEYTFYKFTNSLILYIKEYQTIRDDKKLISLLYFREVLESLKEKSKGKLLDLLTYEVQKILKFEESQLFNSFNDDPEETHKTITLIKKIGFSNNDDISIGFLKNRFNYLMQCLECCVELSQNDIKRAIEEAIGTIKKAYLVSVCYKCVFGSVDSFISTFMNRFFQEFFKVIRNVFKNTTSENLKEIDIKEFDRKILETLDLLAPLGLSFQTLINFSFNSFFDKNS